MDSFYIAKLQGLAHERAGTRAGMDESRLQRLMDVMREDIDQDRYFGGVIAIGRHGQLALHEAVGHADSARKRPVRKDSVFSLFSTTKAITVVLVLRAIERGQLALTTPISDVVPEFSGRGREAITIFHLLTHSSGLPSVWSAREGMYIDRLDEVIAEICKNIYPEEPPGLKRQVCAARASCADGRGAAGASIREALVSADRARRTCSSRSA